MVLLIQLHAAKEAVPREDEVAVDFIHHQDGAVLQAEVRDLRDLFLRPHLADRVVRAAEDQRLDLFFFQLFLQVLKVDGIFAGVIVELAVYKPAPVVADRFAEGVVHRLHHHDGLARLGKGLDAHMDAVNQAGAQGDPVRVHRVAVAGGKPVVQRVKIVVQRVGVAEDAVVDPLVEFGKNFIRQFEVHIRDPHREQIVPSLALHAEIVFEAIGSAAVDDFVEVILHDCSSVSVSRLSLHQHIRVTLRPDSQRSAAWQIPFLPWCAEARSGWSGT